MERLRLSVLMQLERELRFSKWEKELEQRHAIAAHRRWWKRRARAARTAGAEAAPTPAHCAR